MSVVAISNGKGGVGKTASTINLAYAAAKLGARTLAVDLDATTNSLTSGIDYEPVLAEGRVVNMADLLLQDAAVPIAAVTSPTPWGFDVAPIDQRLIRWVDQDPAAVYRLRSVLEDNEYDLVLLDLPPGLGLLSYNGLAAAASVLVPVFPDTRSLEALGQFLFGKEETVLGATTHQPAIIAQARRYFQNELRLAGVIVTAMESTKNARYNLEQVQSAVGDALWEPYVPRYTAMRDAETLRRPVAELLPEQGGGAGSRRIASAYRELAERLLKSEGAHKTVRTQR